MPLQFKDHCYSLGYFALPWPRPPKIIETIQEALRDACQCFENDRQHSAGSPLVEEEPLQLFSIAGSYDLMVVIKQYDFRFSHYFQNALTTFPSTRCTWIHALPYETDIEVFEAQPDYKNGLLFQLFLKAKRTPYRQHPTLQAAESIAKALEDSVSDYPDFKVRLYTTLGWPDCMLWGSFHGDGEKHLGLLRRIEGLRIRVAGKDDDSSLFYKRFSLTGLKLDRESGRPLVIGSDKGCQEGEGRFSPHLLARTAAGELKKGQQVIESYIHALSPGQQSQDRKIDIRGIDGQWDIIASFSPPPGGVSLGQFAEAMYTLSHPEETDISTPEVVKLREVFHEDAGIIEELETHILCCPLNIPGNQEFQEGAGLEEETNVIFDVDSENKSRLPDKIAFAWKIVECHEHTPRPLRNEIAACLSLFRIATESGDNRQAVNHLIHGTIDALLEMLFHLDATTNILIKKNPDDLNMLNEYEAIQEYLRWWCTDVGTAVRQRSSGSFENMFAVPTSVPAYRGSLQKMLHTADGLMRELFGLLPEELTTSPKSPWPRKGCAEFGLDAEKESFLIRRLPRLASVFAPTVTISSKRYLDLVLIPSRYAFSMQLVLPQLWHEVGQSIYFRRFNKFVNPLQDILIKDLRDIHKETGILKPAVEVNRFVGDHFSDLLVFLYGFSGNITDFSMYLSSTLYNTEGQFLSARHEQRNFSKLVNRLLIVDAFHECLTAGHQSADELYERINKKRQQEDTVESIMEEGLAHLPPGRPIYPKYTSDRDEIMRGLVEPWRPAVDMAISTAAELLLKTYDPRLTMKKIPEDIINRVNSGEIVDLDMEEATNRGIDEKARARRKYLANELMVEYYIQTVKSKYDENSSRPREKFQTLAGLGFTALQTFRGNDPFKRACEIRNARLERA